MRNATKHSVVHHFADDTNLMCSDKDPAILRTKMNDDLKSIFEWLCSNRLSLNVSKTEFIIFKPPKKRLFQRITLTLNGTCLYESPKVKYLGIIMDERLSWKHHIVELNKKLNKSIGIIYKMRHLSTQRVLKSLYFALIHSHLNYGACVWGYSNMARLDSIRLLQKRVIRIIANAEHNDHSSPLFKQLNILKFDDIIRMQLSSIMWDYDHENLPKCFNAYFNKTSSIHSYNTRFSSAGKLSENVSVNTITYGFSMLKFIGPKIFNTLKDISFYNESNSLSYFRNKYKSYILNTY